MNDDIIIVPEEDRILKIAEVEWVIEVPFEWRVIEVPSDAFGQ